VAEVAGIGALSCWPGGNCTATGSYSSTAGGGQVFVISRAQGTWGAPVLIRASAAMSDPFETTLSCPSSGNCTLGGGYLAEHGDQVFVVSEKNGAWGQAGALPGVAALNAGQDAFLAGLACFSAGNCTAAGNYGIRHAMYTAKAVFVMAEKNGTWGKPLRVPGSLVNLGTGVALPALSCGAPGNCSIGGSYSTKTDEEPFLDTQKDGTWGKARTLRGMSP